MNKLWTNKWKSVLIWISAYISFIAYALVGGYVIVKKEDEALQKTAKNALIVTIIFTALSALLALFHYIAGFSNNYYSSSAYEFYTTASTIFSIAKIVVYAVFVVLTLMKQEGNSENN